MPRSLNQRLQPTAIKKGDRAMKKEEVKQVLQAEMMSLANCRREMHEEVLKDRGRCMNNDLDIRFDSDYQSHSRLQRSFEDKAFQTLYIMQELGIIDERQKNIMCDILWEKCHAYG